jgi:hypothetical protein
VRLEVQPSVQQPVLFGADASRKKAQKTAQQQASQETAQAEQQAQAEAQAQQQGALDTFRRAFSACMDARGYSVK